MLFVIPTRTFTNHNIKRPCFQCIFLYNILSSHGSHFTGRIPINVIATVPTSTTIITIYQWQRTLCVEGYWIEKSIFLLNADHTPNEKHSTVSSEMCLWWPHQMIKLYRLLNSHRMNLVWILLFLTKLVQNSPIYPSAESMVKWNLFSFDFPRLPLAESNSTKKLTLSSDRISSRYVLNGWTLNHITFWMYLCSFAN